MIFTLRFFFPATDEINVKDAFLENLDKFSHASFLARKYCKNPYDCEYTHSEIDHIKEAAESAVAKFRLSLDMKINQKKP
jgi:hypothetical protein